MQSESNRTHYAAAFKDRQVVDAYKYRLPYPQEVFEILAELITGEPRTVLDVGAGSGDIARNCIAFAERIDAVDFSQNMLERGKQLPNGNDPRLHWIYGKIEEAPLTPPYALITAGSSIHWMDWPRAFPRFRSVLAPNGLLALIYRRTLPMPWGDELRSIRDQFITQRDIRGASAAEELVKRGFLHKLGQRETAPVPFQQSLDDFIEGLHSRSSFSRELMGLQKAAEFDQQVRALLLHAQPDGMLPLHVIGSVIWGTPENGGGTMSELLPLARAWVSEHYDRSAEHLLKAEEWLRRIDPSASEAMLLATVTHDMERAFPGPDSPKQYPALGPDDPIYNQAHSDRSARIVSDFLRQQGAPDKLVTQVAELIRVHEIGGWPDADWVQAADSLSFLEVNIDFFLERINAPQHGWTLEQVRAKFDWMYSRIQIDAARSLATPLYASAIERWEKKKAALATSQPLG